jgi:hypothetical protein
MENGDAPRAVKALSAAVARFEELLKLRPGDIDVSTWLSEARQHLKQARELNQATLQPD